MSETHRISANWRLQKTRYGLIGETCPHCEEKIFPPRDICPDCLGLTVEKEKKPVPGRILFAGKLDKEDKRVLMVKLDDGRVGFGEISGVVQKCLTDAQVSEGSVVWRPTPMREFKPAGNQFEYLLSASLLGFHDGE